jgi:hypothetical protein
MKFRNHGQIMSPAEMLVDRAKLPTLTVPEMAFLPANTSAADDLIRLREAVEIVRGVISGAWQV